jgi:hypothetical protein
MSATQHGGPDEDAIPISVKLGTVIPPEDPEDWRRPLTWVAAAGMLLGPLVALVWFLAVPPVTDRDPLPGTWLLAAALVVGAVTTGSTQLSGAWAFAGTLGGALFGALLTILLAVVLSPESRAGVATPILAHAFIASVAGVAGALAASTLMPSFARVPARSRRGLAPGAIGIAVAALVVQLLFSI